MCAPCVRTTAQLPEQILVVISPADSGYRDLYVHLADDLYLQLLGARTVQAAVETVLTRLRLWGSFLRRRDGQPDGRAIRGLFAELSALETFLVPALGWQEALSAWTGPMGTPQDIVTETVVLDVKATQVGDDVITISSIKQLDPPGNRPVRLLQAFLSEGEGESLHGLTTRLHHLADAAGTGALLLACLTQAGFPPGALSDLPEQPMSVQNWTIHRGDDPGFPALRRRHLHDGIMGASYRIKTRCVVEVAGAE